MCGGDEERSSGTTVVNQTTTPTPTAEETAMNQLQLQQAQAVAPLQTDVNKSALGLSKSLLTAGALPGYLNPLTQGLPQGPTYTTPTYLDPNMGIVGENAIADITAKSLKDINVQLAKSGAGTFMESGASQSIGARAAGDIRRSTYESNLERQLAIREYNEALKKQQEEGNINISQLNNQYNQQMLLNLLNLSTGSSAQVQAPVLTSTGQLSSRLAGLRSMNTSGTQTADSTKFTNSNPFLTGFGYGGASFGAMCWVAAEVFDGWNDFRTQYARYYIINDSPTWFFRLYAKFGKQFAKFIHNKPILKNMIRPLFEYFAKLGGYHG